MRQPKSLEEYYKKLRREFKNLGLSLYYEGYEILENTLSVDDKHEFPRPIPAYYVAKGDTVYLYKLNGTIERIGSRKYWDRIKKYSPSKKAKIHTERKFVFPLFNCGLCQNHKNKTALLNIVYTNRCNLSCWYCFFYSEKAGYVYEPSIDEIKKMLIKAKEMNGYVPPIQITGGEPTLRKDLSEVIKLSKDMGSPHIQLNTHSQIVGMKYFLEKLYSEGKIDDNEFNKYKIFFKTDENGKIVSVIDEIKEWKKNGLNTIYTSFDAVSPQLNAYKNHYELPYAIEAYSKAGVKSIVLVPTVHKKNLKEVNNIVKFAMQNKNKGIKGINFQPISLVGMASNQERIKMRVAQSDIVDELKKYGLKEEDWFPVPAAQHIADVIGKISKRNDWIRFYNNEKCGIATYVYVDKDRIIPITNFIDVDGLLEYIEYIDNNIDTTYGKIKISGSTFPYFFKSLRNIISRKKESSKNVATEMVLEKIFSYIKQPILPDGSDLRKMFRRIIFVGDYESLGKFHNKFMFLGMMHFMDPYNYDIRRVERCSIHYGTPDGRIIPFCTFNVFGDLYRDAIMKKYKIEAPEKIAEEKEMRRKTFEFRRNYIRKIVEDEIYKEYYKGLL